MTMNRRTIATTLTLALGLGVWGVAVNYTPATLFVDGNTLTAAQLNAEFAAIQTAVASKLDLSGGTVTGRLNAEGAAALTGGGIGDFSTVLNVRNTGSSGSAAVFRSQANAANTSPVVSIKGNVAGPALSVKNSNTSGALIAASNVSEARFVVEYDGSIRVGPLGAAGSATPTLRIDAANGTIRNNVGSGIPVAYGSVTSGGARLANSSTSNFQSDRIGAGHYRITIAGFSLSDENATTVVTPRFDIGPRIATVAHSTTGGNTVLNVRIFSLAGALVDTPFGFIIFKPGS
jgi:hypothetical protein